MAFGKFCIDEFEQSREKISEDFFLPQEFPLLDRGDEAVRTAQAVLQHADDKSFAFSLTGRQLENLLLFLPHSDDREAEAICAVLKMRMTERIALLFWTVFQYHADSRPVVFTLGSAFGEHSAQTEGGARLLNEVKDADDRAAAVTRILIDEGGDVEALSRKYLLLTDSPFGRKVLARFFTECAAKLIGKNYAYFTELLSGEYNGEWLPVISNYLSGMRPGIYNDDINILLLYRLGRPGHSRLWYDIDAKLVRKFESWYYYYELSRHFGAGSKKLSVLSRYADFIKGLMPEGEKGIRIDYGRFAVADVNTADDFSYYIANSAYGMSVDFGELRAMKGLGDARDYILGGSEAGVLKLSFHEVGALFTKEMLDILLGVRPDLRKKRNRARRGEGESA